MAVEVADLSRVGERYVQPLLSESASATVVVCRPSKAKKIRDAFHK